MSQTKFIKALAVFCLFLSLAACSKSYEGPVGDTPVTDVSRDTDGTEAPIAKTLFQKVVENGVPEIPLRKAFTYFDANKSKIQNKNYMTIIDFTQHSGQKRFYLIDMKTGAVDKLLTAHGRGSDPEHTGNARKFSNISGSNMTSLGFLLTAERYSGEHGISLRLDGLQSMNSNARPRAIVIHGADYVDGSRPKMGRSLGCPAVENRLIVSLVKKLKTEA